MSASCVTGGKLCSGCMSCEEQYEYEDEDEEKEMLNEKQTKDVYEALNLVKEGMIKVYGITEDEAMKVVEEWLEA